MQTGIAARDYSALTKKKKLKPVELNVKFTLNQLQKLEDGISKLVHDLSYISDHDRKDDSSDRIVSIIVFFAVANLLAIIIIGLLESLYLNQYIQNKKKI